MDRHKVLLVEDNRLLRWWLLLDLYDAGYWVAAPDNPDDAVGWADSSSFDILITDWRLPGGHCGFEMLDHAKAKSPSIRAVLMSAEMDEELASQAYLAGFEHILTKPFAASELIQVLHAPPPRSAEPGLKYEEVTR